MSNNVPGWFASCMVVLAEAYPNVRLREGTVRTYYDGLCDVDEPQLQQAMRAAIREQEFFPTVAALRRYVQPPVEDAAILAWAAVVRAVRLVGAYTSLVVFDPAVASAITASFGSWRATCELEEGPALAQKRVEFLAAYRAYRRVHMGAYALFRTTLPGICENDGGILKYVGTLTIDGDVTFTDRKRLDGYGYGHAAPRAGLPEGADAPTGEGEAGPGGGDGEAGRPGTGGGA